MPAQPESGVGQAAVRSAVPGPACRQAMRAAGCIPILKEKRHGRNDRLGNPGEVPEERGHEGFVLHHGRADAARADALRARRSIRMIDVRHEQAAALIGAGLQPAAPEAGRVHGGERPGRDQSHHRHRQRVDRLLRRSWRIGGSSAIGCSSAGQIFQEIDQVAIMKACTKWADRVVQSEAHSRAGEQRLPEGDGRQARARLSRFPRRRPLREDRRQPGRLALCRPSAAKSAAAGRPDAGRRAGRRAVKGQAARIVVRAAA